MPKSLLSFPFYSPAHNVTSESELVEFWYAFYKIE